MTEQLAPPRPLASPRSRGRRAIALSLSLIFGLDAVGHDLGGGAGLTQRLVDAHAVPLAALGAMVNGMGGRTGLTVAATVPATGRTA